MMKIKKFRLVPKQASYVNTNTLDDKILIPKIKSTGKKRKAVEKAHRVITNILKTNEIPQIAKTFGLGIVRVCCRTLKQLDNIGLILTKMVKFGLIQEVGMPLTYIYKMKTLVLFIKPTSPDATSKVESVFNACSFGYHHVVMEVHYPTRAANKTLTKCKDSSIDEAALCTEKPQPIEEETKLEPKEIAESDKVSVAKDYIILGLSVIVSCFIFWHIHGY
jgi:hypothetical protein